MNEYTFLHRGRRITIQAETLYEAKEKFQYRYGYWPTSAQVLSSY